MSSIPVLTNQQLLELLPYRTPFRFVDEICEVDDEHIVGTYRFKSDEYFYLSHFPGRPVTPGVILLETMAQIGVAAFGLFLAAKEENLRSAQLRILLTEVQCDFSRIIRPGDEVTVRAQKTYFRKGKLKVSAQMYLGDGTEVCSGTIAGVGFRHE